MAAKLHARTATLQRSIRACDDTSLSADFRDGDGSTTPARPLQIKSETLQSAAGPIQVVGPTDNKALCEDVSVSAEGGSCAQPRGWYLTFIDPKPGTFQLQAPVDFGEGIAPSTLTITGTIT